MQNAAITTTKACWAFHFERLSTFKNKRLLKRSKMLRLPWRVAKTAPKASNSLPTKNPGRSARSKQGITSASKYTCQKKAHTAATQMLPCYPCHNKNTRSTRSKCAWHDGISEVQKRHFRRSFVPFRIRDPHPPRTAWPLSGNLHQSLSLTKARKRFQKQFSIKFKGEVPCTRISCISSTTSIALSTGQPQQSAETRRKRLHSLYFLASFMS